MNQFMSRCYLRGFTPLGVFNTITGVLFNRVLVRVYIVDTQRTVAWRWDRADRWPREQG